MRVNEYIPQDEEDAGVQEDAPLDPETLPTMHVYPMKGGLLFLPDSVVSQELDTEIPLTKHTPTPAKEPSFFPQLILILCFFSCFNFVDV